MCPGVRVGRAVVCGRGVSVDTGDTSTATKVCWQAEMNMSMIEANRNFILVIILLGLFIIQEVAHGHQRPTPLLLRYIVIDSGC